MKFIRTIKAGPGAAVNFRFEDCWFEHTSELNKFIVNELCVASYYDSRVIHNDAGILTLNFDTLKSYIEKEYHLHDIKIEDIDNLKVDNYDYGGGYSRCELDKEGFSNEDKYCAVCRVTVTDSEGDKNYVDGYCDISFVPSEKTIEKYNYLDTYDDLYEEEGW